MKLPQWNILLGGGLKVGLGMVKDLSACYSVRPALVLAYPWYTPAGEPAAPYPSITNPLFLLDVSTEQLPFSQAAFPSLQNRNPKDFFHSSHPLINLYQQGLTKLYFLIHVSNEKLRPADFHCATFILFMASFFESQYDLCSLEKEIMELGGGSRWESSSSL